MIVGIGGKIGHGKDTIAQYLVREYGFVVIRMSDPLKEELRVRMPRTLRAIAQLNGQPDVDLRILLHVQKPAGVRELLQEYGTEVRRQDDPDYWVNQWKPAAAQHKNVVAPDIRFLNEAQAVRDIGGTLWRVQRPGLPSTGDHASEQFVDTFNDFNITFVNRGTVEDLERLVRRHMEFTGAWRARLAEKK